MGAVLCDIVEVFTWFKMSARRWNLNFEYFQWQILSSKGQNIFFDNLMATNSTIIPIFARFFARGYAHRHFCAFKTALTHRYSLQEDLVAFLSSSLSRIIVLATGLKCFYLNNSKKRWKKWKECNFGVITTK